MTRWARHNGAIKPVKHRSAKIGGIIKPVRRRFVLQGGVWKQTFQDEVVATLANTGAPHDLSTYFTAADWANPLLNKRVVIPAGVEIGTNTATSVLFPCATGIGQAGNFAGDLIVENRGILSGVGGAANSGVGGTVIYGNLPGRDGRKMIVENFGIIRAGGGGGGNGGQGGPGYYQTPYTVTEGPFGPTPSYSVGYDPRYGSKWIWSGSVVGYTSTSTLSLVVGAYTYFVFAASDYGPILRRHTAYSTTYTVGGAGGASKRGQGYDGLALPGVAGAAGGTNAGAGGKGGNGGVYGATGDAGAVGAAGNNGAGAAGAAGGLAGFYINGIANIELINNSTVLGRVA